MAKTLGDLAEDTNSTIRTVAAIGLTIADRSGSPGPYSTSKNLFGKLAIALWRGNACLWLHRHPSFPPSLDGVVCSSRCSSSFCVMLFLFVLYCPVLFVHIVLAFLYLRYFSFSFYLFDLYFIAKKNSNTIW